ncbi:GNAT family N-acetyltransferase [Leptospira sp. 201903070]|uniref:GNAT family N-acetyltransferase n=1 Tax=Leptospira ainlahdjerensis TaxID=2810033 RepID=A0ABS2UHN9_9LEPT|nr:GNAT family N-acetyltransferase [Leptospira ainlahdjerensis]MBM9578405.1 GNAT family N-acetyltransferase [Leptospira ainlahdjerensis]
MEIEITSYPSFENKYDRGIEVLLSRAYVEAGFTDPTVAQKFFSIEEVKKRGKILLGIDSIEAVVGMVIVGMNENPYRQIAEMDEAEMQLLATLPTVRQKGIGENLCRHFEIEARSLGFSKAVLSTQSSMEAAHRLYEKLGYRRDPSRDWIRSDRQFWVYEKKI